VRRVLYWLCARGERLMPDPPIAVTDAISIPSFEEGALRRSSNCHGTLESAQRGRSDHACKKHLTSPAAPIS